METIEIGAFRVLPDELYSGDTFQTFVRPTRFPQLSDFCTGLTSIKQGDVDGAERFPGAFSGFLDWVGTRSGFCSAHGVSTTASSYGAIVLTTGCVTRLMII